MKIEIKKFGDILVSRPMGKEAFNVMRSYFNVKDVKVVELDFTDVKVMAPSWLDEVYKGLKNEPQTRPEGKTNLRSSTCSSSPQPPVPGQGLGPLGTCDGVLFARMHHLKPSWEQ